MFGSENLILTSPLLFLACVAVSVLFAFLEYKTRAKTLFTVLSALAMAGAFVAFLLVGATLADLLLYLLAAVLVRLIFVMLEGRAKE